METPSSCKDVVGDEVALMGAQIKDNNVTLQQGHSFSLSNEFLQTHANLFNV